MWSTGCCVSAFRMSFSGVWGVFIPRTLNEKKTPGAPDREQLFRGGIFTAEEAISDAMKERGDLQDKQDNSTARTANNGKNQILGPVVCRASIYGLSEAVEPLF